MDESGAKAAHQKDVIVDGFRDADHRAGHAGLLALRLDGRGACIAAIPAHHKHHVDGPHVYPLHNLADVCSTP